MRRTPAGLSALLVLSLAGGARAERPEAVTLEDGRLTLTLAAEQAPELRGVDGRWNLSWAGGERTLEPAEVQGLRELRSSAPLVVTGALRADVPFRLEAPRLRVVGRLSAPGLSVCADELIDVPERAGGLAVDRGGALLLRARVLSVVGPLSAPGGAVSLDARAVLHGAPIDAPGGRVEVSCDRYIGTVAGKIAVSQPGGRAGTIDLVASTRLYSSGSYEATGAHGGRVHLSGVDTRLVVATVDASGDLLGGSVCVGTHGGGVSPGAAQGWHAADVLATAGSRLRADSACGAAGTVVVGASQRTDFAGSVTARGLLGRGGGVELSGSGTLRYAGEIDARGASGPGRVLLDPQDLILDDAAGVLAQFALVDPHPDGGLFGEHLVPVGTGKLAITDPEDDFVDDDTGAAYLFDATSGALLSTFTGARADDEVGSGGITRLTNGNYVIQSPRTSGFVSFTYDSGAATWASGDTGVTGVLSNTNSLRGPQGAQVGETVLPLANGNYVVVSPHWYSNRGAATWCDGTAPTGGYVGDSNSVVGSTPGDGYLGDPYYRATLEVVALSDGDYVVASVDWDDPDTGTKNLGAVRWCSGTAPSKGAFDATNSLVGQTEGDTVGLGGVFEVGSGNYAISSPAWRNGPNINAGAVTWGSGAGGTTGVVSAANSLVGESTGDLVGERVTVLSNGNYVVSSSDWSAKSGSATWCGGNAATLGTVSALNSLIGAPGDRVSLTGVFALPNGHYVVGSQVWNGDRGAVTWCSGSGPTVDTVDASNSLVGGSAGDFVGSGGVVELADGRYVVRSPLWNGEAGAVTRCSGTTSTAATVGATNSLIGSTAGDRVGEGGVVPLGATGARFVVVSPSWDGAAADVGAVTFVGATDLVGAVSASNSLVGSTLNDRVGSGGVIALSTGHYVVCSPSWDNGAAANAGAATICDGSTLTALVVSASNSLVGTLAGDGVGERGVVDLGGGRCVVLTRVWGANDEAAATLVDSARGPATGAVSAANSLLGTAPNIGDYNVAAVGPLVAVAFNGEERVRVGFFVESTTYALGEGQSITTTTDRIARLLGAGVDVTLQASRDLVIRSPIVVDNPSGAGGDLTLAAGRRVSIEANITTDGGDLTVIAGDTLASGVVDADRSAGDATISNTATISAGAGKVTFNTLDSAGLTHTGRVDYTLGTITAASVVVVPFADSLAPTTAVRAVTAVTIEGGGLTGASVTVGGVAAVVSSSSTSSLVSFTPGATTPLGSQPVVLTTPSGTVNAGALTIVARPDLAVAKVVDQANPPEGATITYTVTVTNNGPGACDAVALTDVLPTGVTYVGDTPSQGTYDDATGLWSVGTLADGASATLDLECTVDGGTAETTITNTTSNLGGSPLGGNAADDEASVVITPRLADLAVALTVDNAAPLAGGTIVYTLTVTNLGPSDSTAIEVTDLLPTGVTYVGDTPSQGTYDDGTGQWSVGTLADGASATLAIECTVDPAAPGTVITNTTSGLAGDFLGGSTSDDVASASITVAADVAVATLDVLGGDGQKLDVLKPSPAPLELRARNAGGQPVAGATVTFSAPSTGASATLAQQQVQTDANGRASVVVTANDVPGSYVVTASAGSASASFNLTNVGAPVPVASGGGGGGGGCALTSPASDSPGTPAALAGLLLLLATLGARRVRTRR